MLRHVDAADPRSWLLATFAGVASAVVLLVGVAQPPTPAAAAGTGRPADTRPTAGKAAAAKPRMHDLRRPTVPTRLQIDSLKIDAVVRTISLPADAVLRPPGDPAEVGWWDGSARPGGRRGQTVLTGHTVHRGGGALDRLGDVGRHRRIRLVTPRGVQRYQVQRVTTYTKAQLATRAQQLFGQDHGQARLVLVTCTGWTGNGYTSNIVVVATRIAPPTSKPVKRAKGSTTA